MSKPLRVVVIVLAWVVWLVCVVFVLRAERSSGWPRNLAFSACLVVAAAGIQLLTKRLFPRPGAKRNSLGRDVAEMVPVFVGLGLGGLAHRLWPDQSQVGVWALGALVVVGLSGAVVAIYIQGRMNGWWGRKRG
jgi:hypothetical protein